MRLFQGNFTLFKFSYNNNELTELTNERINEKREVTIRKFDIFAWIRC